MRAVNNFSGLQMSGHIQNFTGGDAPRGEQLAQAVLDFQNHFSALEQQIGGVIVGQRPVVRGALMAIFAGGHVLLEGVPGLGKTLLVKSIAKAFGLEFKRIQFTPDLMPSDVTGTQVLTEDDHGRRRFVFKQGPIFANIVLADEINRATPKTQAALLEAMEERQITVLDQTYPLPHPFFVLATQNPVELEGTYPLPEAQLDRFMIKLLVPSPTSEELKEVLLRTTGAVVPQIQTIFSPQEITAAIDRMRQLVRSVVMSPNITEVLVRIIAALTPSSNFATQKVKRYVRFGPGPRGAQAVTLCSKVVALLDGRVNVAFEDIKETIVPALRHRLLLNFEAEADGVSADSILNEIRAAK